MDADADMDRLTGVARSRIRRGSKDRQAAIDGARRGWEDDVEAVALGLDLSGPEAGDDLAHQGAVGLQEGGCGVVAVGLDETGVAAQVSEQEPASRTRLKWCHPQP